MSNDTPSITFHSGANDPPVLIIDANGIKYRGSDRRPINELEPQELLELVHKLCDVIAGRRP